MFVLVQGTDLHVVILSDLGYISVVVDHAELSLELELIAGMLVSRTTVN